MENDFKVLMNKMIYAILNGDGLDNNPKEHIVINGIDSGIENCMPYLSGLQICEIASHFGLAGMYGRDSRWVYFHVLMQSCVRNNTVSDLLTLLFSEEQFKQKLHGLEAEEKKYAHLVMVQTAINQINRVLYSSGHKLIKDGVIYKIVELEDAIRVNSPSMNADYLPHIKKISVSAFSDILDKNFDGAIAKSNALLKEVFSYAIEQKGDFPDEDKNINVLYNQVKQLYNMQQNEASDNRVNELLSGLDKIVNAISDMRNPSNQNQEEPVRPLRVSDHHARLFVNSSMIIAEFLLAVCEKQRKE